MTPGGSFTVFFSNNCSGHLVLRVRDTGFLAGTSGYPRKITCKAPSDHFKDGRSVNSLVEDLYHKRVAVDVDFLALDVVGAGPVEGRLGQTLLSKGRDV